MNISCPSWLSIYRESRSVWSVSALTPPDKCRMRTWCFQHAREVLRVGLGHVPLVDSVEGIVAGGVKLDCRAGLILHGAPNA